MRLARCWPRIAVFAHEPSHVKGSQERAPETLDRALVQTCEFENQMAHAMVGTDLSQVRGMALLI